MAVDDNIDDHFDFDDSIELSKHDVSFEEADLDVRSGTNNPADEFIWVLGDAPDCQDANLLTKNDNDHLAIDPADEFIQVNSNNLTMHPVEEICKGAGKTLNTLVPTGISKITELTLDQFENNYKHFAQKLADVDTDLVIRAILLKNNDVYNYSFKIQGTDNLQNATISAANKVCNLLLGWVLKGNTLVCSLGAGHNGAHTSITRNVHIPNFINTLNKIKDKTGLYIIVQASNYDWLEYAGGNTIYEDLFVTSGLLFKATIKQNTGSPGQIKINELVKGIPWQVH